MQQMIEIQAQPGLIQVNYEQLEAALAERLEQYRQVVSPDGVKAAKAQATEINALKKTLAERRKKAADEARQPITEFERQMKALEQRCEEARQDLLEQVRRYEDQTRERARALLASLRDELWQSEGVSPDYRTADYEDLVLLSSVTPKGALTKAAREKLQERVRNDRDREQMVTTRLLELEARSYREGLHAPLTREHVEHVLVAPDDEYESALRATLDRELERQEQAARRQREQWEREQAEARAREQAAQARRERAAELERAGCEEGRALEAAQGGESPQPAASTPGPQPPPAPAQNGKVRYSVLATFYIEVSPRVKRAAIEAECRRVMERAGVTTLQSVQALPINQVEESLT
ncbi:DUF1351 domain-containing protein [Halorhodospira sp. 9622]|uniref:DUF1351 domain-containing protein n=1 Tax=Halorhodospira sp. 9622 TaxID=2899136 RepID=UPI001EE7EA80|nr:DUF1351 domain-containing protein [Halorhodospira sp. 9622]MCG5537897.1 DUF1351 domain-containing protein [Halorhodospira sp. 9622]